VRAQNAPADVGSRLVVCQWRVEVRRLPRLVGFQHTPATVSVSSMAKFLESAVHLRIGEQCDRARDRLVAYTSARVVSAHQRLFEDAGKNDMMLDAGLASRQMFPNRA
jgi:hypothetical protein